MKRREGERERIREKRPELASLGDVGESLGVRGEESGVEWSGVERRRSRRKRGLACFDSRGHRLLPPVSHAA